MNVTFIVDNLSVLGGVETHIRDLSYDLTAENHSIQIITGASGVMSEQLSTHAGIQIIECPKILRDLKRPDHYLHSIFEIAAHLKNTNSDIVHSHGTCSQLPARAASRLLSIPSIHTVHGWSFGNPVKLKSKIIDGACHSISSAFNNGQSIFVSHFNRDHALKRGYVGSDTSTTIHNGIPDISVQKHAVHTDHRGQKEKPVNLVMVARLSPEKDHTSVLQALAKNKDLNWTVDFAGGGDDAIYKQLTQDLGIADRCRFLGEIEDIPNLLSQKDIFILGSHHEGLPISIIEAMRAKLPVIASDVGGISELVSNQKTGFTVPRADPESLSQSIRQLITNDTLRADMGFEGRRAYEQRLSIQRMMSQTHQVYTETIGNHVQHFSRPGFLRLNS